MSDRRRVALVHDWLTGMRGGEKVLDAICELFPDAPLYTLVHVKGSVSARIEARRITTSFAQRLPGSGRYYRQYLPLFPAAVELFDLDAYDLVISTSHCAVKSVVRRGAAAHVSYCHSPMRYAWDQFDCVLRPGPGRARPQPRLPADHGGPGAVGSPDRRTGRSLRRQFALCCSADPPIL